MLLSKRQDRHAPGGGSLKKKGWEGNKDICRYLMFLRENSEQIYAINLETIDDVDVVLLNLTKEEREIPK